MRVYRLVAFVMAIWVMAISGSNYAFSNYSSALKQALGINQVQLNTLSVGKDLGKALGIVAGIASDHIPVWAILLIGATLGFSGFGMQWVAVSSALNPFPYWMIFIACALAGNSVAWYNTAVLLVSVKNFPRNRGPVVGLLKGYLGLSPAIFSVFCDFLFSGTASHFLLLLTILPSTICITTAPFLRIVPPAKKLKEEDDERSNMLLFCVSAIGLALYIILVEIFSPSSTLVKWVYAGILLLLLLVVPVLVPIIEMVGFKFFKKAATKLQKVASSADAEEETHTSRFTRDVESCKGNTLSDAKDPLLGRSDKHSEIEDPKLENLHSWKGSQIVGDRMHGTTGSMQRFVKRGLCGAAIPELGEDASFAHMLRSFDFWAFYVSCLCSGGAGVAFSNNLGQIGESLGFDNITLFTSLFSVGGFAGRILSGLLSEHFLRRAGITRSFWMATTKLPMIVVLLWLSGGSQHAVYIGTVVMGFCFGFQMAIMIPMVSELYGLKHFGTNYNISVTTLLVGSFLFSDLLAGIIYDKEALKQQTPQIWVSSHHNQSTSCTHTPLHAIWPLPFLREDTTLTCYGSICYRLTFIILAIILLMGLFSDVLLAFITRPLYKKIQKINTALS